MAKKFLFLLIRGIRIIITKYSTIYISKLLSYFLYYNIVNMLFYVCFSIVLFYSITGSSIHFCTLHFLLHSFCFLCSPLFSLFSLSLSLPKRSLQYFFLWIFWCMKKSTCTVSRAGKRRENREGEWSSLTVSEWVLVGRIFLSFFRSLSLSFFFEFSLISFLFFSLSVKYLSTWLVQGFVRHASLAEEEEREKKIRLLMRYYIRICYSQISFAICFDENMVIILL